MANKPRKSRLLVLVLALTGRAEAPERRLVLNAAPFDYENEDDLRKTA